MIFLFVWDLMAKYLIFLNIYGQCMISDEQKRKLFSIVDFLVYGVSPQILTRPQKSLNLPSPLDLLVPVHAC